MKTLSPTPTPDMVEAAYPLLEARPHNTPDRARRLVREIYAAMWEVAPKAAATGLTRRQKDVQRVIAEYIAEHKNAPTYQDIADALGMGGRDEAWYVCKALIRKGVIARPVRGSRRGLLLLVQPGEYLPTKEVIE